LEETQEELKFLKDKMKKDLSRFEVEKSKLQEKMNSGRLTAEIATFEKIIQEKDTELQGLNDDLIETERERYLEKRDLLQELDLLRRNPPIAQQPPTSNKQLTLTQEVRIAKDLEKRDNIISDHAKKIQAAADENSTLNVNIDV
jgi:hypothetical protein